MASPAKIRDVSREKLPLLRGTHAKCGVGCKAEINKSSIVLRELLHNGGMNARVYELVNHLISHNIKNKCASSSMTRSLSSAAVPYLAWKCQNEAVGSWGRARTASTIRVHVLADVA